jgi:uncharacterized membrane protein YjjP (DUF1212 family)
VTAEGREVAAGLGDRASNDQMQPGPQRLHTELLAHAGRLLLEYNESAGAIHRALAATAAALTVEPCHVAVYYRSVTVSVGGDPALLMPVRELRYNTALQARVRTILDRVRAGDLEPAVALDLLGRVEAETPRHNHWTGVVVLGVGAAALAGLLGADPVAVVVAGLATALGLFVRQQLGRWHFSVLTPPMVAAFLGAALGGLAIRLGWTGTPELVLVVPALMLVPGAHLINGVLDLLDNHLPMCLSRLGLAAGILLACALGIALGAELTLPGPLGSTPGTRADHLNLITDMVLAGIVTCGFAVVYNTPWAQVGWAAVGGMVGHGLRYLALEAGSSAEVATFLGGLAVGAVAAQIARSAKLPIAVIAFAGAVTMMPGLQLYRALAGARHLARLAQDTDPGLVVRTLGNAFAAGLVVCGLVLGLVLGTRVLPDPIRRAAPQSPPTPSGSTPVGP